MGIIEDELQEIRKLCEHLVSGSRLVSCVRAMVRIEITRTRFKALVVCIQFPGGYPAFPLLLELKSKTLSENLLQKLTNVCENEIKSKFLGKPQVLKVAQFIRLFLQENPLSCCYDEISEIKRQLGPSDELKLKQKDSAISLRLSEGLYCIKAKITLPDNYPDNRVRLQVETNFPGVLDRYILFQAKEEARVCVEPPLKGPKKGAVFVARPSLLPVFSHLAALARALPHQRCPVCRQPCLPLKPEDAVTDETAENHVERIYCGHLYHQGCLILYMKTPPFKGGKKCLGCGQRIYHDKWKVSEKLAEDRWAHQEARARELGEVEDFFK